MIEAEMQSLTADIVGVFVLADADGNGELTKEEFLDVIGDTSIRKILHSMELDLYRLFFNFGFNVCSKYFSTTFSG